MKFLYFFLFVLLPFVSTSQKKYTLNFINTDYKVFKKNPTTTFKDSISLKKYLIDLKEFGIKRGYLLTSIDSFQLVAPKNYQALIYVGEKFERATLHLPPEEARFIRKNSNLSEKILLNTPLTPVEFHSVLKTVQQAYLNDGYPFVSVQLDSATFEGPKLEATIRIEKGIQLQWKEIHVKGDSSISKKFVGSLIGIKPKDTYSEAAFLRITQKIKQINYFEELKPAEILFTKNGVELYTYLKSKPMSSVNGIIGLQPNPVTGKMSLTGELSLRLQNILKRGELLYIDWRSIQPQTQSLKTQLTYPYLFNTNFGIDGTFDLYKRDSTFLEIGASAGINYYLNGVSYIKAFYQHNASNLLSGAGNSTMQNLGSVKVNAYGLAFVFNQVDYIPNPRKGLIIDTRISVGTRNSQLLDSITKEKTTVYRASLNISGFIPLAKRHVLLLRNRTNVYQAPVIFANEAYRYGGATTQRGFNEEELYATSQSTFTAEYRFIADKNSFAFAFFDQSFYENNSQTYYKDQPFGFGVGFSFGTTIGVFSISYAMGKQNDNPIQFKNGKIHFGYIAYF